MSIIDGSTREYGTGAHGRDRIRIYTNARRTYGEVLTSRARACVCVCVCVCVYEGRGNERKEKAPLAISGQRVGAPVGVLKRTTGFSGY